MISLVKLIIAIILAYTFGSNKLLKTTYTYEAFRPVMSTTKDSIKLRAFVILTNKCNKYHNKRNKPRVFTEVNMNSQINDVYNQVFIKKRMPKGKSTKLTSIEYQELLTWITSTKTITNGS